LFTEFKSLTYSYGQGLIVSIESGYHSLVGTLNMTNV
jgi:hypothetical protein